MGLYAKLTKKYGSDVSDLRKILVKKILDESKVIESYDGSLFNNNKQYKW